MNLSINLNVCRVCMKPKKCQKIFSDSVLNKKWLFTTRLPLDKNDNLPKQLCDNCIVRLKVSYDFVQAAQTSDKNLRNFLHKIQKDFDDVAKTSTSDKTNDENSSENEDGDDLISLLRLENKEEDPKPVEKSKKNVKSESKSSSLGKANSESLLKKLDTNDEINEQIASPPHLIKNEQELDIEMDTETQEFEVAIDQCEEDYQLYEGINFVEASENLDESTISINDSRQETDNIGIDEVQVEDCTDLVEEGGASSEACPPNDNDEIPIRINTSGDGFLKEYEGSLSDGGNETIDYIDAISLHELRASECEESQGDISMDDQRKFEEDFGDKEHHYELKLSSESNQLTPKSMRKNPSTRRTGTGPGRKGRSSLPSNTRFLCLKCNRDFSTKTNLNRHMVTHEGVKPYECKECFKCFTQNGSLKQHMLTHTGQKPYVCEFCNRAFSQSKSLVFHLRRHTGEKPFLCDFCGLNFRQKDGLKNHILRHHMAESVGNSFICIICKKVSNNKAELQMHMLKHVNNHKNLNMDSLQAGEQNAEVILELINEDDEDFTTETTTIFPEEMSLSLSNISSSTHVIDVQATSATVPSRAKKFQCRKCFKCFAIKKNFIRHLSIHDVPVSEMFQCEDCEIAFDTQYALNLHLVRDHKQPVDNLNKCEECQIIFDSPGGLNKHMDECHQYVCAECPQESFKSHKMLMEHMLEHELENEELLKFS